MAHRIAATLMTLSDFQGHSLVLIFSNAIFRTPELLILFYAYVVVIDEMFKLAKMYVNEQLLRFNIK